MKIFLSHSSRHKPLVREVKNHLPQHIKAWIDEKDLLVGDEIERSIKNAIEVDSDFVILFIDQNSLESKWIKMELEWALEHEANIGRTFVIPVVLELEAWQRLEPTNFKSRKYIECVDFSEDSIKGLANSLISQLFAWLSRDLALAKNKDALSSSLKLLDEADRYLIGVANEIRFIVHSYHREDPLALDKLFDILKHREDFGLYSEDKFNDLLIRLRQQGYLAGLVCDGENIFVEEEHYGWKTTVFTDAKRKIARKASNYIHSGSVIALDAGSTTIEIARQICRGIKMRIWNNLTVVTNSISAANELMTTADEIGLEDDNKILRVYLPGGRIRANTLAIVEDKELSGRGATASLSDTLKALGGADIAFVGTNGIFWDLGFTTHDLSEVETKSAMLGFAKRKFVITDPSKFGVRQGKIFATFDQDVEILTTRTGNWQILDEYEHLLSDTRTKIIYAE